MNAKFCQHVEVIFASWVQYYINFYTFLLLQLSCQTPQPSGGITPAAVGKRGCLDNPKYYSYIAVLALIATTMLVQVSHMVKLTLMLLITVGTGIVNVYSWTEIFDQYDLTHYKEYRQENWETGQKFALLAFSFICIMHKQS